MKLKYAVIATLAFTGHLAWAEGTTGAAAEVGNSATAEHAAMSSPVEKTATEKQIKALETDVSPSLQSKLDALMSFDAGPVDPQLQEVASAH